MKKLNLLLVISLLLCQTAFACDTYSECTVLAKKYIESGGKEPFQEFILNCLKCEVSTK